MQGLWGGGGGCLGFALAGSSPHPHSCPIPLLSQKKGLESYEKEAEKRGCPQALPEAPLPRERGEALITQKGPGGQRREPTLGGQ